MFGNPTNCQFLFISRLNPEPFGPRGGSESFYTPSAFLPATFLRRVEAV